jgi:hypothetical protein
MDTLHPQQETFISLVTDLAPGEVCGLFQVVCVGMYVCVRRQGDSREERDQGRYLQWWARSGLMLQHLGHLYTTCPGFNCKLSMNSLVAFPLGTAPGSVSMAQQWEAKAKKASRLNTVLLMMLYT